MMAVDVEQIAIPATLYRVGRQGSHQGLWYDDEGRETKLIHQLKDGAAAALPMGPHPIFRADGRRWISVTETLSALAHWFSMQDMLDLAPRGFAVEAISVVAYRRLHFPTYSHEVYSDEHMTGIRLLSPFAAFLEVAA